MKKVFPLMIIILVIMSSFVVSEATASFIKSKTTDPTNDLYHWNDGSPAPTWSVIDIVYAEISRVNSTHIKLLIRVSSTIPLTNQWQGYHWLLDTGIPSPPAPPPNPIDDNDIIVDYAVGIHWAANGPLAIRVTKYDGTPIYFEDARNHPEKYFSGDTCSIIIPLSWIGNPSKIKWVAGSTDGVGDVSGRHDKAPNSGHVTLRILRRL